jgi:hypothetical protein
MIALMFCHDEYDVSSLTKRERRQLIFEVLMASGATGNDTTQIDFDQVMTEVCVATVQRWRPQQRKRDKIKILLAEAAHDSMDDEMTSFCRGLSEHLENEDE